MSSNFYAVCDFGEDVGRVMLGTLHKDQLVVTETRRFQNVPLQDKEGVQWNIPQLYRETLDGLREIASHDEPLDSVSCSSSVADYMLFAPDGSLMTPTYHHRDARTQEGAKEVFAKVPWETVYGETGVQRLPGNTLLQLGAEKSKRLKKAGQIMPVADGFNFLLAGVPRVEMSLASLTQLYNPITHNWSEVLINALELPQKLFPQLVPAGTKLGDLKPDIAKETKLEDTRIVTACSHEIAAALVGLPIEEADNWAFLRTGASAVMGTELSAPIISDVSREWNYNNETGYGGSVAFYKHTVGMWILDECRRFWSEKDRDLGMDMLMHLAISAPPFESLINLSDPRFLEPGDMPLKIVAYCKETNQQLPRKPGPAVRCILESLALLYRKTLCELEFLTNRHFKQIYLFGSQSNDLLNHFIANALQIPVVLVPSDVSVIGNMMVQALALGHIKLLDQARDIVKNSFKTETIIPHAAVWDAAYDRFAQLVAAPAPQA